MPLEAHFVHTQRDGDLVAVLSVIYNLDDPIPQGEDVSRELIGGQPGNAPGVANGSALAQLAETLPLEPGEGKRVNATISPADLLPTGQAGFWQYVLDYYSTHSSVVQLSSCRCINMSSLTAMSMQVLREYNNTTMFRR